ncbi:MAG TPA: hypothetical protein VML75_08790 [Kofleriaceae bacterium]|nr:hypothetical protein [Kofleriaceae bacterium]
MRGTALLAVAAGVLAGCASRPAPVSDPEIVREDACPDEVDDRLGEAEMLRIGGHLHRALQVARAADATCRDVDSMGELARILSDLGLDEEAVALYREIARVHSEQVGQEAAREAIEALAKRPPAVREASDAEKEDALLLYRSGVGARIAGDDEAAIQALRRSYALWPHPITIVQIALAHRAAGREVEALATAERALAIAERITGDRAVPRLVRGHFAPIRDVAWSPDRRHLATISADGTAIVWDAVTGVVVHTLALEAGLGDVVRFSGDGARLFAGGGALRRMWWFDVARGTLLGTAELPRGPFDVDSAGRLIVSGGPGEPVVARELGSAVVRWQAPAASGASTLRFSPDGSMVAVAIDARRCALLAADSGAVLAEWPHVGLRPSLAFSPDGRLLAIGTSEAIAVYDTGSRRRRYTIAASEIGQAQEFTPDGRWLISSGRAQVGVFDAATGAAHARYAHPGRFTGGLAVGADGATLAVAGGDESVFLLDTERGTLVRTLGAPEGRQHAVAFSADGSRLALGGVGTGVWLWRLDRVAAPERLAAHTHPVRSLGFSRDGRRMLSIDTAARAQLWDARGARALTALDQVVAGAFSFDSTGLLLTGGKGDVTLVSARDGAERGATRGAGGAASTSIAVRADGRWVALGRDGALRVQAPPLAPRAGRGLVEISGGLDQLEAVEFLPDGEAVLFMPYGRGLGVLDTRSPAQPVEIEAHDGDPRAMALSPSGALLATGGSDARVQLWRVPALEPHGAALESHLGVVNAVAFSADERTVASASSDKTVILWDVATGAQLATIYVEGDRWLVLAEDGRVDGNTGSGADDPIYWQVGGIRLPSFVGWDRARTPDLVRAILSR